MVVGRSNNTNAFHPLPLPLLCSSGTLSVSLAFLAWSAWVDQQHTVSREPFFLFSNLTTLCCHRAARSVVRKIFEPLFWQENWVAICQASVSVFCSVGVERCTDSAKKCCGAPAVDRMTDGRWFVELSIEE